MNIKFREKFRSTYPVFENKSQDSCSHLKQQKDGKVIRGGLAWIDGEAKKRFQKGFADCAPGDQTALLDDIVKDVVTRQGRVVTGDTAPEEGFYWRSDHLEFGMGGVPSLATSPGIDFVGKPAGYGAQKRQEYIRNDYHKPTDQVKPDWDLTGAAQDLQVLLETGYRVAQSPKRPVWRHRGPYMNNPHAGK